MKRSIPNETATCLTACRLVCLILAAAMMPQDASAETSARRARFDPSVQTNLAAGAYFAPTSLISFRMRQPDGLVRELDYGTRSNALVGAYGWRGRVNGDETVVWSGKDVREKLEYRFLKGRLREYACNGKRWRFAPAPLPEHEESVRTLWGKGSRSSREESLFFDVWRGVGRLRLGFTNPNRASLLLVELGLLSLGLLLVRRTSVKIVGAALACAFFLMNVLTGSRSGVVAFFVGVLCLLAFHFRPVQLARRLGGRSVVALVIVAVTVGSGLFFCGQSRVTSRLLRSDPTRVELFRVAPKMMTDAPAGWDWYAQGRMTGPGKAYFDWYQPMNRFFMPLTLVSDHLTQLVRLGWAGRFGYLFGWTLLLVLLAWAAVRRSSWAPLTLSIWLAFLVCSGLNRIIESHVLWLIPVGATLVAAPFAWRSLRLRRSLCSVAVAGLVAATVLAGLRWKGEAPLRHRVAIRTCENRVLVNRGKPQCWVVDDGTVFGGGFVGKEMRLHCQKHRRVPCIGYVRDVSHLPCDVHRLVLGGEAGWDFLMGLNDGKFPADFNVPEKIVFVSPPFPPQAIPELLLKNAKVKIVIGEFAAAYFKEYGSRLDWVEVVPGAELYIPGWMRYVVDLK